MKRATHMAREKENTNIDDVDYVCHMMPATMANKALVELSGALGHPLLVAISTMIGGGGGTDVEHVVDTAMKLVMTRLSPDDADRICKMMLNGVSASKAGPLHEVDNFDAHFRGRLFHMWKVVFWSINVNYRDFFYAANSSPTVSNLVGALSVGARTLTATLLSGAAFLSAKPSTSET